MWHSSLPETEQPLLPPEDTGLTRGEQCAWWWRMSVVLLAWGVVVLFGVFCWWLSLGYFPTTHATFWQTHPLLYEAMWLATFLFGALGCTLVGLMMFVLNIKYMGRPYARKPQCRCNTPSHSEEEWV